MQTLKKKGLTALIAAILMFSMVLATMPMARASPALTITFPYMKKARGPDDVAEWSTTYSKFGTSSFKLSTPKYYSSDDLPPKGQGEAYLKIFFGEKDFESPLTVNELLVANPLSWSVLSTSALTVEIPVPSIVIGFLDVSGNQYDFSYHPYSHTDWSTHRDALRATPSTFVDFTAAVSESAWSSARGGASDDTLANLFTADALLDKDRTVEWVMFVLSPYFASDHTFQEGAVTYIDNVIIKGITYDLEPKYTTLTVGNVGDTATVSGTSATLGGLMKVYWDSVKEPWDGTAGLLAETYPVGTSYSFEVTIPETVAGKNHYIIVKDVEAATMKSVVFDVNPKIILDPTSGVIGDTITVEGTGFTATSEITITGLPAWGDHIVTSPVTVTTNDIGSFSCTFEIPTATGDGTYAINAYDGDENAWAYLKVGTVITLTPKTGLVGITVTVEGRGFTADGTVDIRWYMAEATYITLVNNYPIDETGDFSTTFAVPLVPDPTPPGADYAVEAYDSAEVSATATFTVVEEASITLVPVKGRPEDTFTVSGTWFTESSTVTITFDGTELATGVATGSDGSFATADLEVPDVAAGTYTVTAIDAEGLTASATFTVLPPPAIVIRTRATEYSPGDTVSFYINSTSAFDDLTITIKDPTDYLFTTLEKLKGEKMDGWYGVSYELASFILPSDATPGLWNWTATVTLDGEEVTDTGLFTVFGVPPGPPGAEISEQETLDSTGAPKTSFALGETVLVSAKVTNVGTASQPMLIVVQLMDPDLRALAPSYISVTLPAGLSLTPSLGFIIPPTGYATGTWTAKIMVLDTWPALGGVPIAEPVTVTFTVTS